MRESDEAPARKVGLRSDISRSLHSVRCGDKPIAKFGSLLGRSRRVCSKIGS